MPELTPAPLPSNGILANHQTTFPPLGSNINVLMVWPRFPSSFWGFEGVLDMLPEAAMTPPLGLITVAALCPPSWNIRLMDQCFQEIRDEDLLWADLVMVSAMHAQRFYAREILLRARASGVAPLLVAPGPAPVRKLSSSLPTMSWWARPRKPSPGLPKHSKREPHNPSTTSSKSRT
jgi:hypothetical protein